MSLQFSSAVRNGLLDSIQASIGVSAIIKIWSGIVPVNAVTTPAGTMIAEFDLAVTWAPGAASSMKTLSGLPIQTTAVAPGVASFFRMYAADGVTCHMQGTIGVSQSGEDMILDNTNIRTSQVVKITAFTMVAPGA